MVKKILNVIEISIKLNNINLKNNLITNTNYTHIIITEKNN